MNNCYACRNYFEGCEERHEARTLLWAKHLNGWFYWGREAAKHPGRWVKICRWCRDALSDN